MMSEDNHYHDECDEIQGNQMHYWAARGIHDPDSDLRVHLSYKAQTAVKDAVRGMVYEKGVKSLYEDDEDRMKHEVLEKLIATIQEVDEDFNPENGEEVQDLAEVFLRYKYD